MRELIAALLALTMLTGVCACGNAGAQTSASGESASQQTGGSQIPNPIDTVSSAADFASLGVRMEMPEDGKNPVYCTINGDAVIAQIQYDLDGRNYTLRGAKTAEDISGIYEKFDDEAQGVEIDGVDWGASVRIRTIDGGRKGALATWFDGELQYSLYTGDSIDLETMSTQATKLAEYTNSKA